jgi:hypothetical protein
VGFTDVEQHDTLHTPAGPGPPANDADGDVYDVLLTLANGTRVLEAHPTATYEVYTGCDGECHLFRGNI